MQADYPRGIFRTLPGVEPIWLMGRGSYLCPVMRFIRILWSLLGLGLLLWSHAVWAQQGFIRCGTMQADSFMRALYPDWPKMDDYEGVLKERVERYKAQMARARTIGDVYRIPVVVHVIHNGEAVGTGTNISTQRIQDQIAVLNEDFRRLPGTPGWNNHPRGADVKIEFVLARRDPNGNPTTGIVRWDRNVYGWSAPPYTSAYMNSTIKPATQWDPDRYLNIWVADLSGGLLGYAQFPDLSGLLGMPGDASMGSCTQAANTDGVVILYSSFGSALKPGGTGMTPPYHLGRTTTHEVGHWLGLRHTWGDGDCSVDDFCDDTPLCNGPHYGCTAHPVPACITGQRRMIENYMDYSDDGCMNIFTIDQAVRMRIVLENCPRRASLITSPALVPPATTDAAIINTAIPQDLCPGTYNINATLRNNGTTTLTSVPIAYRINSGPWQSTTWTGSLAGGNTTTVTLTGIDFSSPGDYTLTVCSNLTSDPDRTEDTVTTRFKVHNGFYPLFEDFEAYEGRAFPPSLWRVNDPNNDCFTWRPGHCVGSNGQRTTAMFVNLWAYPNTGRRDELYSPIIDLTSAPATVALTFDVAYRRYDNTSTDELRVEISTDCGATWSATPIYAKSGATLATGANTTARYVPGAAGEWRTETVSLSAYTGQRIRLRFVTVNQYGNNIWIDNVRITHLPFVFFRDTGETLREELTWPLLTGDCRRYRDITIPVYISSAPSANVNVAVSLASGSTAYAPGDVQVLTPTLTFPAGSTAPQNLTVRVFDDDGIDSPFELAALRLSISSGPALVDPQRGTYRLWIEDNDFFPPEVVLFQEDFEAGATGWSQVTITSGSNRWVRGTAAGMGGSYAYYITNNPSGSPPPYQYSTGSTSRVALVSPSINTTGATDLVLAFDVRVNGEYDSPNLYDFGRVFYSTTSASSGFQPLIGCGWGNNTCALASEQPRTYQLYGYPEVRRIVIPLPSATWNQPNLWLAWRWDNDNSAGNQPPMAIDNIVLYGRRTPSIENTLTTQSVYFGPQDSVYVYSPNGRLMVTLVNQGTHDYGCTSIQIDRTGTSAQALRPGHTPPQYVTNKTFLITPTTGSATNAYTIYLHYTSAEKAGWETTTGNTWSAQAYVVKTAGSISAEFSAPTPTYTMNGVTTGTLAGGFWAKGNFTGFSGFAVGAPPPLFRAPERPYAESLADPRFYAENPWSDRLRIWCGEGVGALRLWSVEGRLIWQTQEARLPAGWHEVSLTTATAGLYLLEWVSPEGLTLHRQKLYRLP